MIMIENKIIYERCAGDKGPDRSYKVDEFIFPAWLYNENSKKSFRIKEFRDGQFQRDRDIGNPNPINFRKIIQNLPEYKWVEEFPIPIINQDLWFDLCPQKPKCIFSLDVFLPDLGIVIELDSSYHDGKEKQKEDMARDLYLGKEYDIITYRTRACLRDNFDDIIPKFSEQIKEKLVQRSWKRDKFEKDIENLVLENYKEYFRSALYIISKYEGQPILTKGILDKKDYELLKKFPKIKNQVIEETYNLLGKRVTIML